MQNDLFNQPKTKTKEVSVREFVDPITEMFGEPISVYTRAQAIDDGYLIDVSDTSEYDETGWKFPVAIESEAWAKCVETDKALEEQGQSVKGRLWDVLYMARHYIKRSGLYTGTDTETNTVYMKVSVTSHRTKKDGTILPGFKQVEHALKIVCGPGDHAEPVITIGMFHGKLRSRR